MPTKELRSISSGPVRRALARLDGAISKIEQAGGVPGPQGPPGPPGPPGPAADAGYVHVQGTPASVWSISHPLAFFPNVSIVDSAEDVVEGEVSYDGPNLITLTFTGAFSGKAYLS